MGLSIGAFLIIGPGEEDCDYHFVNNPDFPGRADDITSGWYIKTGWYTAERLAPSVQWGYSGYSEFREWLARLVFPDAPPRRDLELTHPLSMDAVDWANFRDRAFQARHPAFSLVINDPTARLHELINFSDCEGIIGYSVCKKLLSDLDSLEIPENPYAAFFRHEEMLAALKTAIKAVVDAGPLAVLNFS